MDDFLDEHGIISLWRLAQMPRYSAANPHGLSNEMRDRLFRLRLAQIECEAAENAATLRMIESRRYMS